MKRRIAAAGLLMLSTVLSGCIPEKRVVWSPDGRRAALIGGDGLYVCNETGRLSERLAEAVEQVVWLSDSQRLVAERTVDLSTWEAVRTTIDAERVKGIKAGGERLRAEVLAHEGGFDDFEPQSLEELNAGEQAAAVLYLRDELSEGLPEKLGAKWTELEDISASARSFQAWTVGENSLEPGPVLAWALDGTHGLTVSPDGRSMAYVERGGDDGARLYVVPVDGSAPPRLVDEQTTVFPAWSGDGRFLAYAVASGTLSGDKEKMELGVLVRRAVADADGGLLAPFGEVENLAGLVFSPETMVACLRDGRILFATLEIQLPCTSKDMPQRMSLFAVDPDRQPTVQRVLPRQTQSEVADMMHRFQLSPDQRRVCVPGGNGEVTVLELATGRVWSVLGDDEVEKLRTLPTWRSCDELCLTVWVEKEGGNGRDEIVLAKVDWESGEVQRRVLSKDWPQEVVLGFLVDPEEGDKTEAAEGAEETPSED